MTTGTSTARALAAELDQRLPPGCLLTGPDYDRGRRVWNGAIDHAPALIVRPHTPNEIPTTILAAQHHGVPISVRGGGHDWAGRSVRHGGLVIDLSAMNRVVVDPQTRLATLQGGATTGDVIRAAQAHRLSAATGKVGGVGMAGLALGGGYGPMIGRYGLALDNLIGAEVVLADGRCVAASPSREPELYWALRGGGGNFGVVTSLSVQLHPVPDVLAGLILYPWHQAAHAWTQLDDILAVAPDELTVRAGILRGPEGGPLLFLSPVWCGDLAAGETTLQPLLRLGTPLSTCWACSTRTSCPGGTTPCAPAPWPAAPRRSSPHSSPPANTKHPRFQRFPCTTFTAPPPGRPLRPPRSASANPIT
jgi:FAD/FMN-containing dehydrogenase